ncbi:MAG: hypothetical protein P1U57_06375, partial [Oleibacter sp.]|nr:hypothetical protein [Thalassolituus sp.]
MKFLISLSIMLGIAAMTGCAQSPLSPKGDAIFYALQADSMMNTWRYECSTVSSRAEFEADVARAEWWRRNKETVQAADYGLGYNVLAISDDRVSTGARMAMGMTLEIQQRSEALVNEKLNNTSDKEALCIKVLGQYREGTWDIKGPEEMEDLLMKMKQESNNNQEALEVRRGMIEKATGV